MSNTYTDHLPMPEDNGLPTMPGMGETGPQVCTALQLYLGMLDDLSAVQVDIIRAHVRDFLKFRSTKRSLRAA
jgi:hypothetical protein